MTQEQMEKLLRALKDENEEEVNNLACEHFICNDGHCNWKNILEFEKFASVRIVALEKDSFGWLIGGIKYGKKTFSYG